MVHDPTDLSKLSYAVQNEVVKKGLYDELVQKATVIDTNELVKKIYYNTKINEIKDEIPSITGLATTIALNAVIMGYPTLMIWWRKQILMQKY